MEIPFSRWYPAIEKRKSRRQFDSVRPVPPGVAAELKMVCRQFRPFKGARVEMLEGNLDNVFTGVIGSYGKVKGATNALLFIGEMSEKNVQEAVGYTGEAVILEAVALGLGTCWIAGNFNSKIAAARASLGDSEKILAVSPLGYPPAEKTGEENMMAGFARSLFRKPLSSMTTGISELEWADWVRKSIEAARLAPSARNRQPWIFTVEQNSILVSRPAGGLDLNVSRRLDCGIAMLHLEIGAGYCGVTGRWEMLENPKVARFYTSISTKT